MAGAYPKRAFTANLESGSCNIFTVAIFYLGRDLQKPWKTVFLESGSVSLVVFYIFMVNVILFFVLGILFDGAAFPYGEIHDGRYWIVNNAGTREISESWFWFTYWHGLAAWLGVGLIIGIGAISDLALNNWTGELKKVLSRIAIVVGMALWLFVSVLSAIEIAQA